MIKKKNKGMLLPHVFKPCGATAPSKKVGGGLDKVFRRLCSVKGHLEDFHYH
jgi:hypothetical protein